jgi:hypothetical protein
MKFFQQKVLYGSTGLHLPRLVPLQYVMIGQIASVQCEGCTLKQEDMILQLEVVHPEEHYTAAWW